MSMSMLTAFQFLGTLLAYLFITIALPCAVLNKKLRHYRFMDRALLYFIIGSFYATNLVFLLQILHISYYITILIGLLVIPAIIWCLVNKFPLADALNSFGHSFGKYLTGSMGFRSAIRSLWALIWKRLKGTLRKIGESIRRDWPDWLLTAMLIFMVMHVYGTRMESDFGYTTSDVPVHLYWVNALSDNTLFVEGIYPFGMHAIIYLIHMLFGIDTYVVFRVFSLVQCLAIHMTALLFLRLCCKSRFAAYAGVFVYAISNYILPSNIIRYLSTLPQETSIIYILPTAYFALMFLREKRREITQAKALKEAEESTEAETADVPAAPVTSEQTETAAPVIPEQTETAELAVSETTETAEQPETAAQPKKKKRSRRPKKEKKKFLGTTSDVALAGLAMSFSLCLSTHTYGALVAAMFCIGIGVGFIGSIIRPAYFMPIIVTALIGVSIAALPMAIAYATGTPFEDSALWARNVVVRSIPAATGNAASTGAAGTSGGQSSSTDDEGVSPVAELMEKAKRFGTTLWNRTGFWIETRILGFTYQPSSVLRLDIRYSVVLRVMMIFLVAVGIALQLIPRMRQYGAMVLSAGICMVLLSMILCASELRLPVLIDTERTSLFYSYMLIVVIGFTVDACLLIFTGLLGDQWNKDVLSFAAVALVLIFLWQEGDVRESLAKEGLETNEAITCLTNIIATEKDNTWTIFSAGDETQMVHGHGYHYELSTFLEEIEQLATKPVTVPTQTVYFFIEKIPVDYVYAYWGSGQPVSVKGAQSTLPSSTEDAAYIGENRWIIMSRMYYWAQEFQRLYPNEMRVYLETDQFICYRLKQNTYRLFDLSIDYGYNTMVLEDG